VFHPKIVEATKARLRQAGYAVPEVEPPVAEVEGRTRELEALWNPKLGRPDRPFTEEEAAFVVGQRLLCQASFEYWCSRFAKINIKGSGLRLMYPLLDTQKFILQRVAQAELACAENRHRDGILLNLLKGARQVGGSTFAEAVGAYKFTTQEHIFGLVAADVPDTSAYMFDMFERIVEHLPWWLTPGVEEHVKNKEMRFSTQSHVWVGSGRSTRGAEGQRGQLGRGKTLSWAHLSELSTWDEVQAQQINGALLPTMPMDHRTFALFESTAKGRDNWWHKHWRVSNSHKNRFTLNIFIPWYVESKYAMPCPVDWAPAQSTLAHARHCEETSPRYLGRQVTLSKEQLYWYEFTRSSYEAMDDLKTFVEEYGSVTDDETFQHSGYSIFSAKVQQRVRDQARPFVGMAEIRPQKELR
jgi:hypothetical protein